jgi:hypothetical protein
MRVKKGTTRLCGSLLLGHMVSVAGVWRAGALYLVRTSPTN